MRRRDKNSNRGAVALPTRRRREDPMAAYDRLPAPLRAWLQEAALPWSAQSCQRIWQAARRDGLSPEAALARLDAAERKTLNRSARV
ncbi:DUF6525 family protein [Tritonibacter mobilis]|uniref:DUF6525 family protein n=1 Tax=Tritonibacter mobilis TaxID=379347 RepID=UPI000A61762D|nr:DUF6525 family protein [Tritonibacter mobilis]